MRVAAGAVARKVLQGVTVRGALVQVGPHKIDRANWDWAEVDNNAFFSPDAKAAAFWADYLDASARPGLPSVPSSKSLPKVSPPVGARRSTASWTRILLLR